MGTHSTKRCKNHLLFENEIIADKVNENIKKHVACATRRIPESLVRNQPAERRIQDIKDRYNQVLYHSGRKMVAKVKDLAVGTVPEPIHANF